MEYRDSKLNAYIAKTFVNESKELEEIRLSAPAEKRKMQLSPSEGKLLYTLLRMYKSQNVLEVGTFVGYSTKWISMAVSGKVVSIEKSLDHFQLAKNNLKDEKNIEIVNGNAADVMKSFQKDFFDAVFIDADKLSYPMYLEESLNLLPKNGLLIADNTLLWGAVYDDEVKTNEDMREAMKLFNTKFNEHFDAILIPSEAGLTIGLKK